MHVAQKTNCKQIVNKNNRVYGSIPVEFVFVDEAVPHAAADGHDFTRAHQLSHALIKSKVIDCFDKFLCLKKISFSPPF